MNLFEILAKWPGIEHEAAKQYTDFVHTFPAHINSMPSWNDLSEAAKERRIQELAARKK